MSELSNAVTVLIARMESHPDDFDMSAVRAPKFGYLAPYLTKLAGGGDELAARHGHSYVEEPFWFLSDADKEALVAAWKQYHYKYFEKRTMENIFDDGEGERELAKVNKQLYQAQQRAMIQNQMMQSTGTFGPGQIHPLQNSVGASSGSGFLGNIFGGSK